MSKTNARDRVLAQLPAKFNRKRPELPDSYELILWFPKTEALREMILSTKVFPWEVTFRYNSADVRLVSIMPKLVRRKLSKGLYTITDDNDELNKQSPVIRSKTINAAFNRLQVQKERAVGGRTICKKPLIKLVKRLNAVLVNRGKKASPQHKYPYSTMSARCRLIADLINWFFKSKYNFTTNYKPEQIRKLIEPSML